MKAIWKLLWSINGKKTVLSKPLAKGWKTLAFSKGLGNRSFSRLEPIWKLFNGLSRNKICCRLDLDGLLLSVRNMHNSSIENILLKKETTEHLLFSSKFLKNMIYLKVTSSNTSRLEAHAGFFRLLMKGIFDPYVMWPFDKLIS